MKQSLLFAIHYLELGGAENSLILAGRRYYDGNEHAEKSDT